MRVENSSVDVVVVVVGVGVGVVVVVASLGYLQGGGSGGGGGKGGSSGGRWQNEGRVIRNFTTVTGLYHKSLGDREVGCAGQLNRWRTD